MSADAKIQELGIELPPAPAPMGVYKPIVIAGSLAYLSGHGPVQPDGTLWLRLRYVAPDLATGGYAAVAGDFAALCAAQALGYPTTDGRKPAQAVISISSAPVEFATTAPGVMQVFEAFRLENDTCVWEEF